jgi:hypothetical protein
MNVRTFRGFRAALVAATALMLWAPAVAQEQEQDTVPPRPFVRGGVFDKPYLFRLAGRIAIGGYLDFVAQGERVDGVLTSRSFDLRRFNLFTATQISDFVRVAAEIEFEPAHDEVKIEYAAVDILIHRALGFRGGMLLSPLGRFNLSHDSPLNDFVDRPLVSTELQATVLSEPGLGAFGVFPVGGQGRITYEVYLTNGFHDGLILDSPDGTRVSQGKPNFIDNNTAMAGVGRVAWSPSVGNEFGVSAHTGAYNTYQEDGVTIDERRNLSILALDAEVEVLGFRSNGAGSIVNVDIPDDLRPIYATDQAGLYLEVVRDFGRGWINTMPQSFFTVGARFDAIDLDTSIEGDHTRQLSVGFNFRPTAETVAKFGYVRGRGFDRFNNPTDFALLQLSVASYF